MASEATPFQVLAQSLLTLPDMLAAQASLSQLPKFSGTTSEYRNWMLELERHFMINRCDEDRQIKILFQTTTGPVCEFVKRYISTNRDTLRYDNLKAEIKIWYGEISDPQHALRLLRNVKQLRGENVATYAEKVLGLARDACERDPPETDPIQRVLIGHFTDGLISDTIRIKSLGTILIH